MESIWTWGVGVRFLLIEDEGLALLLLLLVSGRAVLRSERDLEKHLSDLGLVKYSVVNLIKAVRS